MKFFNIRIALLKNDFSIYFANVHYYFYHASMPNVSTFGSQLVNGQYYTQIKRAFRAIYSSVYKDYDMTKKIGKDCYYLHLEIPRMYKRNKTIKSVCSLTKKLSPYLLESTISGFFELDKYLEERVQDDIKDFAPFKDAGIEIYFVGNNVDKSRFNTSSPCSKFIKHKITINEYNEELIKSVCSFIE